MNKSLEQYASDRNGKDKHDVELELAIAIAKVPAVNTAFVLTAAICSLVAVATSVAALYIAMHAYRAVPATVSAQPSQQVQAQPAPQPQRKSLVR